MAAARSAMKPLDAERARTLAWLALGVYIAGLAVAATLRVQGDFTVYYRTGERVLAGAPPYPPADADKFLYAPLFAFFFAPLAMLPRRGAQLAFFIVNAAALVAYMIGAGAMLFGRARKLSALLIAAPVALTFRFIGNNVEHGQINLIVLALIVWAIVWSGESRGVRCGIALGAAILIKPFAILAAIYLALRRRWAALAGTALAAAAMLAAPIVAFGPARWMQENAAYLTAVTSMTDRYRLMLTNQSAVSALARVMHRWARATDTSAASIVAGTAIEAVLTIAVVYWIVRTREEGTGGSGSQLALAGLFCVMPAMAPISWKSYYAALLVPYMALVARLWEDRPPDRPMPRGAAALFIASVLLNFVPGRTPNRIALFYSAHFVSSLFALGALFTLWKSDTRAEHAAAAPQAATAR
jgi:Glycosyltransferase family 87